mmetsp:Transcript_22663/g.58009  ORF Transcript_22663/g.58009 Transcript_22663/m.58009 type:complete len:317 (+) Transcript_22663:126-1076(+)
MVPALSAACVRPAPLSIGVSAHSILRRASAPASQGAGLPCPRTLRLHAKVGPPRLAPAAVAFATSRRSVCLSASQEQRQQLVSLDSAEFAETHRFYSYANWLVPGELMVGRYPFLEANRCKTRIQGEDQLRSILQTGITVFCSLQAELPEQVKMPVGGKNGFVPYKATVDLMASAMSGPVPQEQQTGLRNPWLDSYLPPRNGKAAPVQENKVEPQYARFPITDMDIPSNETMDEVLDYLCATIGAGKKLYLHCWGGRGRAATVGACYLMKAHGLNAEEALQRVQLAYNTRNDPPAASPETDAQVQFVREYEQRVRA